MVTKEQKVKKYCCFYVSDFHLEMILLPYIKNNIEKSKILIVTQEDLSESIKLLLDRTNLKIEEKNNILNLNWSNEKIVDINCEKCTIIINGDKNYISKINHEVEKLDIGEINIIDCYNINDEDFEVSKIGEKYEQILNTKNL